MKNALSFAIPALWLFSFLFSLPLLQPYEISRFLALICALAAGGLVLALPENKNARFAPTLLMGLILALTFWLGMTFFWSVSPFITIIAWGTFWLLPLWFLIFAVMPLTENQIMLTLRYFVGAAAALAIWALAQFFIVTDVLTSYGSIRHPFADPNNYAGLLNLGLFIALAFCMTAYTMRARYLYLAAAILMIMALVLIGSRTALAIMLMTALLMAAFLKRDKAGGAGLLLKPLATLLVLVGLTFLLSALYNTDRVTSWERLQDITLLFNEPSWLARLDIWSAAVTLIRENVALGTGFGTFFLLYPSVRLPSEIHSSGLMAHADPLQFWMEAGAPTAVLFYALLIAFLWRFVRYLKSGITGRTALFVIAIFCSLLTLAAHLHLTFHLYVPSLLVAAGLLSGVFVRLTQQHEPPARSWPLQACGGLFLLTLGCFAVVYGSCLYSEMKAGQAVQKLAQNDIEGFSQAVNQAGAAGFGLNPRPYTLAATIPLGLLQTGPRDMAQRQILFEQTDRLLDLSLARSPVNPGAYYAKALLYASMKKPEMRQYLDLTLQYDPRHAQAGALKRALGSSAGP